MLERAWKARVRAARVAGDAVYGSGAHFRRCLEQNRQPCALAVWADQRLWAGSRQDRMDRIADGRPAGTALAGPAGLGGPAGGAGAAGPVAISPMGAYPCVYTV